MTYRRGDAWYCDVNLKGYGRITLSSRQSTKRVAADYEATLRHIHARGDWHLLDAVRSGSVSLAELYAAEKTGRELSVGDSRKLADVATEWMRGVSDRRYQLAVEKLVALAPGVTVSWLRDPANIRRFVQQEYRAKDKTPATERREMYGVGHFIRYVYGEETRRRVLRGVMRTGTGVRDRYLEPWEAMKLKDAAGEWWILICLSLVTGIRRGELLALQVSDIDLDGRALRVRGGKSPAARRVLPLTDEAVALLRGHMAHTRPTGRLWHQYMDSRLTEAWEDIRRDAGLADIVWHTLRHTFGVWCARAGMDLRELQVKMGHANVSTTVKHYANHMPVRESDPWRAAMEGLCDTPHDTPDVYPHTSAVPPRTSSAYRGVRRNVR